MMSKALCASSLVLGLLVTGCSTTPLSAPGDGGQVLTPTEVLGQSALPPGASVRAAQSLIMGSGENWVGRVVADAGRDTDTAYRFFLENYPAQGWTLISAVRGRTSLIVLTRQDRTATVELTEGQLMSPATVVLTVSPRNTQVIEPRRR